MLHHVTRAAVSIPSRQGCGPEALHSHPLCLELPPARVLLLGLDIPRVRHSDQRDLHIYPSQMCLSGKGATADTVTAAGLSGMLNYS